MKALVAYDYGPPSTLVVTDVPTPPAGPGQVLVRVQAASLNPLDIHLISAGRRDARLRFPFVVGMDAAGTVASVGTGVTRFVAGDPVLGYSGGTAGTVADYAVIDDSPFLAHRPEWLEPVRASAIPGSGLTAVQLLRAAELRSGQTMLVIGATGGIGMFAVQLAVAVGVEVIGTAAPDDGEYVRSLGAAHVIDHAGADVTKELLAIQPEGADIVLDLVNAGPAVAISAGAARPGGRLVSPLSGPTELGRDVTAVYLGPLAPQTGDLDRLAELAAAGTIRVEVGAVYPFDRAAEAVTDFATRHIRGKVVVTI